MDSQTLLTVVMLAFVAGLLYLSSRSKKKQLAAQQAKLNAIAPGVRVMTIAGLQGEVVSTADDTIEIEIAPGVRTTWLRSAVRDVLETPSPQLAADDEPLEPYETTILRDDKTTRDLG